MSKEIIIGLHTEGTTDQRFLQNIIQRTFEAISESFNVEITIVDVVLLEKYKGKFINKVLKSSQEAFNVGVNVLCVQSDADDKKNTNTYQNSINPAKKALEEANEQTHCKILVPIVPIYMIEAWMLADKVLLKYEIGTDKSDNDLKINRKPETITDPKELIKNAIRIVQKTSKRHQNLSISELYEPLGAKISLTELDKLSSYKDFKENVKNALELLKIL